MEENLGGSKYQYLASLLRTVLRMEEATTCVIRRPYQPASELPFASIPTSDPSALSYLPSGGWSIHHHSASSIQKRALRSRERWMAISGSPSTFLQRLSHMVVFFSCSERQGGVGQAKAGPQPQSTCLNLLPASREADRNRGRAPKTRHKIKFAPSLSFWKLSHPRPCCHGLSASRKWWNGALLQVNLTHCTAWLPCWVHRRPKQLVSLVKAISNSIDYLAAGTRPVLSSPIPANTQASL